MAVLRCIRCGSNAFFCENCFLAHHRYFNTFHVAELWEVSIIVSKHTESYIDPRPFHDCEHKIIHCLAVLIITVGLDHNSSVVLAGIEHSVTVVSCGCEPLAVTLARARLWPATPQFLRYAFTELRHFARVSGLLERFLYFKCRLYQEKVYL